MSATRVARGKSPARPAAEEMTPQQALAQELALRNPRVQARTTGHRSEVFGVRAVGNHYPPGSSSCATADCWQVEIYNFDEDATVTAIVDVDARQVLDVLYTPGVHPGINKRLSDLALEIALNHPDVVDVLGYRPTSAAMVPMDAGLLDSSCELDHLCVAVTVNLEHYILWAVVDLTEEKLAGLEWTYRGQPGSSVASSPGGCPPGGAVNRDGWQMSYETTGTDGLRVYDLAYQGVSVATSIKIVEWHADYGVTGFIDAPGCGNDGKSYPIDPYGDTRLLDLVENQQVVGFELVQDFRMWLWGEPCHYRYEQHMQFFTDGRFRVIGGAYGQGCDPISTYRPVMRIDLAIAGAEGDSYARWDGAAFVPQATEAYWTPDQHQLNEMGYTAIISDTSGQGFYLEPGMGQFGDGGRGDAPFLYVTRHRPDEGDMDIGALGDCCYDDHRQGPDEFVNGEPIANTNIVVWYAAQMETQVAAGSYYCWTVSGEPDPETYPCFAGPMFVPNKLFPQEPPTQYYYAPFFPGS